MDEEIRILLVDDEINVLHSLERTFLDDNYAILTASSGAEGLAVLREITPVQVVVSDYRMPVMDGVDFLREVCRRWPETVRIVLSGYADTGVVISAINEGEIYKFIPKPWNDAELRIAVINALERYFLGKKNAELTGALFTKIEELKQANADLERLKGRGETQAGTDPSALMAARVLQALPVGVIVIDGAGVIIQCNEEAAEFISRNPAECIGARCSRVLPAEVIDFIHGAAGQQPETGLFLINGFTARVTVRFILDTGQTIMTLIIDREESHDRSSLIR